MLQRNDTGYEQNVMAWPDEEHPDHLPFVVVAGEVIDFPTLLAGFTEVDAPVPEAVKVKVKEPAAAAVKEEGEPQ